MAYLLEVRDLSVYYGTVRALEDASFSVEEGEIIAIVGPNGSGKSTALNAVCGLVKIETGEVIFQGEKINGLMPDALVKRGLCLVPEGRRVFPTMTVMENLEMGAFTIASARSSEVKERIKKVFSLFPILKERIRQRAGTLSSGEQQMLAIGRALMLRPSLLLLDEPSLGLSPTYVEIVFEKLVEINKNGTSVLLVEQNARMALEICHRGYVFGIGSIALEGEREALIRDEGVRRVFLGS